MSSPNARFVVTEETVSVGVRRPAEGFTLSGSAGTQALLTFCASDALPVVPGRPGRQISIEGWARETFGKELADFLKPLPWYAYDDLPDDPGRLTEMPDEGLVGGWLGSDDEAEAA